MGICTFKRETDVERNIKILIQEILDNKESPLYNLIDVYISDNGNTLPLKNGINIRLFIYSIIRIMVVVQDLQEQWLNQRSIKWYILQLYYLMDDDILLLPSVFIRLHYFVRVLKDEFKNSIIGGANLNLQKENIQSETCGFYNAKMGGILLQNKMVWICVIKKILF